MSEKEGTLTWLDRSIERLSSEIRKHWLDLIEPLPPETLLRKEQQLRELRQRRHEYVRRFNLTTGL